MNHEEHEGHKEKRVIERFFVSVGNFKVRFFVGFYQWNIEAMLASVNVI